MKLQLVDAVKYGDNSAEQVHRWCGSQADAAKYRAELKAEGVKRKDITTTEIEVPTSKAGLLAFLNEGKY